MQLDASTQDLLTDGSGYNKNMYNVNKNVKILFEISRIFLNNGLLMITEQTQLNMDNKNYCEIEWRITK